MQPQMPLYQIRPLIFSFNLLLVKAPLPKSKQIPKKNLNKNLINKLALRPSQKILNRIRVSLHKNLNLSLRLKLNQNQRVNLRLSLFQRQSLILSISINKKQTRKNSWTKRMSQNLWYSNQSHPMAQLTSRLAQMILKLPPVRYQKQSLMTLMN